MPGKKTREKKSGRRRPQAVVIKAGKPLKSSKFGDAQKALARVTALAKSAVSKPPRGKGTRIDVIANPFRDAPDGGVWVEMGPLWLEKSPKEEGDQEVVG